MSDQPSGYNPEQQAALDEAVKAFVDGDSETSQAIADAVTTHVKNRQQKEKNGE